MESTSDSNSSQNEGTTPSSSKKPFIKQPFKNPKRFKPYANIVSSSPLKYGGKTLPTTLTTTPIKYYHPIFTSTAGMATFSRIIYDTYSARDQRIEKAFTPSLLSYVSTLALTYRIYRLGMRLGYKLGKPEFYSQLEELSSFLTLPEPIAKYIESVGYVVLPQGVSLVPHVPTTTELANTAVYPSYALLSATEQAEIPRITEGTGDGIRDVTSSRFVLSTALVGRYMQGAAIGAKFGTLFRKVDWAKEDGTFSFAVSFEELDTGRLVGQAPCEMESILCQMGACYRLRDLGKRGQWLGNNESYTLIHTCEPFYETVFITDKVMNHMVNRT